MAVSCEHSGYLSETSRRCNHDSLVRRGIEPPFHMCAQDLLNSGYTTEVDSFSKMLHGVAALLPDLTQVFLSFTILSSEEVHIEQIPAHFQSASFLSTIWRIEKHHLF